MATSYSIKMIEPYSYSVASDLVYRRSSRGRRARSRAAPRAGRRTAATRRCHRNVPRDAVRTKSARQKPATHNPLLVTLDINVFLRRG